MKESKVNLIKDDMEYVAKRIKILLNTLSLELQDDDFSETDIQSVVMDFYSTLSSTAKRVAKEHELD